MGCCKMDKLGFTPIFLAAFLIFFLCSATLRKILCFCLSVCLLLVFLRDRVRENGVDERKKKDIFYFHCFKSDEEGGIRGLVENGPMK
jgi:hypothetical protein